MAKERILGNSLSRCGEKLRRIRMRLLLLRSYLLEVLVEALQTTLEVCVSNSLVDASVSDSIGICL